MSDNKEILFTISATLTSKATYGVDGKTVIYDASVISGLLSKIESELPNKKDQNAR